MRLSSSSSVDSDSVPEAARFFPFTFALDCALDLRGREHGALRLGLDDAGALSVGRRLH